MMIKEPCRMRVIWNETTRDNYGAFIAEQAIASNLIGTFGSVAACKEAYDEAQHRQEPGSSWDKAFALAVANVSSELMTPTEKRGAKFIVRFMRPNT